jgi:hypothetical protein
MVASTGTPDFLALSRA